MEEIGHAIYQWERNMTVPRLERAKRSIASALQAFYRRQVRESIKGDEKTLCVALAQALQIEERIRSLAGLPSLEGAQT